MRERKLVVGLISREYPPHTHVGGIGTYTATAARLLADRGHAVHVFCNGPETIVEQDAGIAIHRLRMNRHPLPQARWLYPYRRWFRDRLPNYLDALTWAHTVANTLRREAAALRLDALEFPETNGEGARLDVAAGLERTRRVCRIHTSWLPEYVTGGWESRLLLRLQRAACARADRVVSPSRNMAGHYARSVLRWRGNVEVNPNPLRLWEAPLAWESKNPRHLLFVGRVEHRKGLALLLAALDALEEKGAGWTLRVVGAMHPPPNAADARCQEVFRQALQTHGGNAPEGYALEYFGQTPHAELHRHFDWAGIAVLPSRQDNFPYTSLEALSRGCFVLASDAGGLPETLEGCQGEVFSAGDQGALNQKMRELGQSDQRVRAAWKPNALALAKRFDAEACTLRLLKTYADLEGALEPGAVPRR